RSGDVDPAIVPFIMAKEDLTIGEVKSMLNKHSGLMGISGISSDMREIEAAMFEGNQNAALAFDMFVYRIRKYIGAYTAAMNGLDILIFTAGVGENSGLVREKVCESLTFLGLGIDHDKNENNELKERKISSEQSKVDVFVIQTNEELVIARDTVRLVNESE
ncbi:MAG: acetate kinase, partial [Bacilli bacterium]